MLDDGGVGPADGDTRGVAVGLAPVAAVVGVLPRRVGQTQGDGSLSALQQWRADAVGYGIAVVSAERGHADGLAVGFVVRGDLSVPQLQLLADVGECFQGNGLSVGILQRKTDSTEVQAVRIDTEILRGGDGAVNRR